MTLRTLSKHFSPNVEVWIIKQGCTDPSTFKKMSGYEAHKEYSNCEAEVKDFNFDNNTVIIII